MRWRPRRSLCRPGSRCEAWQDGRHLRAAQRGPYERVSQSRELLYSVPAALHDETPSAYMEGGSQHGVWLGDTFEEKEKAKQLSRQIQAETGGRPEFQATEVQRQQIWLSGSLPRA